MSSTVPNDALEKMQQILIRRAQIEEDQATLAEAQGIDFDAVSECYAAKIDGGKVELKILFDDGTKEKNLVFNDSNILAQSIENAFLEVGTKIAEQEAQNEADFEALKLM